MDRVTITAAVSRSDVQVTVARAKSKPASVMDMVRLFDDEKDFLTGWVGDIGVIGGSEAADDGVVVAIRIAQIKRPAVAKRWRKGYVEETAFFTAVYSI